MTSYEHAIVCGTPDNERVLVLFSTEKQGGQGGEARGEGKGKEEAKGGEIK